MNWAYLGASALLPLVVALVAALALGAITAIRLNHRGGDSGAALRCLLRTAGGVFLVAFLATAIWDGRHTLRGMMGAALGSPRGYRSMGILRIHGEGPLTKNPAKAVHWFEKAARLGDAEAQLFMARALAQGYGTAMDPEKALPWAEAGARQGNPAAMTLAGDLLARPHHPASDAWYRQALSAYQPALAAGDAEACMAYGQMHAYGKGTPPDPVEALAWMLVAARKGLPPLGGMAVRLTESNTPPAQRALAYRRAEAILQSMADSRGDSSGR